MLILAYLVLAIMPIQAYAIADLPAEDEPKLAVKVKHHQLIDSLDADDDPQSHSFKP